MALTDIFASLRGAKNTIHAIDAKLKKLGDERARVEALPPHTDDLRDWLLRDIDTRSARYLKNLAAWHLNDEAVAYMRGGDYSTHPGSSILSLGTSAPAASGIGVPEDLRKKGGYKLSPIVGGDVVAEPSMDALTFFLSAAIRQTIADHIDEWFPAAKNGTKAADRAAQLQKIDKQTAALQKQRAELADEIEGARQALTAPAGAAAGDNMNAASDAAEAAAYVAEYGGTVAQ